MSRFARRYGASPLHLLAHLVALPFAAWSLLQVVQLGSAVAILLWLAGSIVAHDLVLLPLYSLLDRAAARLDGGRRWINFVRVPTGLSPLLGLAYVPEISLEGQPQYRRVSGRVWNAPLERWLLACAGLFALSLAVHLVRGRLSAGATPPRRRRAP